MNNRVFISTPISGFATQNGYLRYRKKVLALIKYLRTNGYDVCSEAENINDSANYDSPAKSVKDDFSSITNTDYFILLHPARMQTSSLIEFGYACAKNKKILAVGRKIDFPYLVIGCDEVNSNTKIVEIDELDACVFPRILTTLREFPCLSGEEQHVSL